MFEKCGVYLSVSINLVICGAIVYYFHKKVNSLEIALMKQSQLFSSFIQDFQRDMNRVNYHQTNTLASPEAIIAVSKLNFDESNVNNKIEVSDDSESSDSDDSDNESESESDDNECENGEIVDISDSINNEQDEDIKRINLNNFEVVDENLNIESMDLNSMDLGGLSNQEVFEMMSSQHHVGGGVGGFVVINGMPMMMNMNNINNISNISSSYIEEIKDEQEIKEDKKIIILKDDSSDDDNDNDSSDDEEDENEKKKVIKKPKKVLNKKNIIMMDIHDLSNTDLLKVEKKEEKIENMKIDDLRKMVIDKSLALKENVKKMKKPELLQLLFEKK